MTTNFIPCRRCVSFCYHAIEVGNPLCIEV